LRYLVNGYLMNRLRSARERASRTPVMPNHIIGATGVCVYRWRGNVAKDRGFGGAI
jgi:hypothetical protein